jgi:hypothetical protein
MTMDASPRFTHAQPMLRSANSAPNGTPPRRATPTTRRESSTARRAEPPASPDNIVVAGFVPPVRDPLSQQVPGARPGWSGSGAPSALTPVVVPSRRNRLARASFLFTGLGVFAAGAALLRVDAGDAMLAGAATALAVVLLILSSALAIGGVVAAARRRIAWFPPLLALLLALALLAGALYLAADQVLDLPLPTLFA